MARAGLLPARSAAEDAVGAGQREPGDERGLEAERSQVLGLKVVHVALAAGSRQDLDLGGRSTTAGPES